MARTCCKHGIVEDIIGNKAWVCCELPDDHIGRHQHLMKQKTRGKGYIIVLWDNDVPHPNGLCPNCGA